MKQRFSSVGRPIAKMEMERSAEVTPQLNGFSRSQFRASCGAPWAFHGQSGRHFEFRRIFESGPQLGARSCTVGLWPSSKSMRRDLHMHSMHSMIYIYTDYVYLYMIIYSSCFSFIRLRGLHWFGVAVGSTLRTLEHVACGIMWHTTTFAMFRLFRVDVFKTGTLGLFVACCSPLHS